MKIISILVRIAGIFFFKAKNSKKAKLTGTCDLKVEVTLTLGAYCTWWGETRPLATSSSAVLPSKAFPRLPMISCSLKSNRNSRPPLNCVHEEPPSPGDPPASSSDRCNCEEKRKKRIVNQLVSWKEKDKISGLTWDPSPDPLPPPHSSSSSSDVWKRPRSADHLRSPGRSEGDAPRSETGREKNEHVIPL